MQESRKTESRPRNELDELFRIGQALGCYSWEDYKSQDSHSNRQISRDTLEEATLDSGFRIGRSLRNHSG